MQLAKFRGTHARGWLFAAAAALAFSGPLTGCGRPGRQGAETTQTQLTSAQADVILKALASAPSEGFAPSAFPTTGIEDGLKSRDFGERAAAQQQLIAEIVAYSRAEHGFAIPRSAMDKSWGLRPVGYDAAGELQAALAQNHLPQWLASLPPQDPQYQLLRNGYLAYLKVAQGGGWPIVPDGAPLRLGSRDPRVALLRQRLAFEDDGVEQGDLSLRYDVALDAAVQRFQARHGLNTTGVVDAATLAALNVPAITRAAQIRANLERWRWAPRETPATRIEVNSAAQTFDLYLDGQPALHMLTAAGRPGDETPIVASKIHTIVFNPTWNVPPEIAQNELYPKGAEYLEAHDFVQEGDRLVQQPGPQNALGQVKFLFDNRYSVYLHDTPARAAFNQSQRSVSHGCVRLEKAVDLARLLLGRFDGWDASRFDEALARRDTQSVPLKQPVPVRLYYWTAWVEGGQVAFRDDIYGWDEETLRQLDAATVNRA